MRLECHATRVCAAAARVPLDAAYAATALMRLLMRRYAAYAAPMSPRHYAIRRVIIIVCAPRHDAAHAATPRHENILYDFTVLLMLDFRCYARPEHIPIRE